MKTTAFFTVSDPTTVGTLVAILALGWAIYTYFNPWNIRRPILVRLMCCRMPVTTGYVLGPDGTSRAPDQRGIVELPRGWSQRRVQVCGAGHEHLGDFRVPEPSPDLVTIEVS